MTVRNCYRTTLATFAFVCAAVSIAPAATFTIDGAAGTVYDSIIDGFPTLAVKDGTPDFGGNALAVALKNGITEERAIIELPLTALAGLTSADVVSATLTINIDDVVGSFGPGANFDGTAAENIFVWGWNGNGTVELTDFGNVAGAPAGSISTGPQGTITDATLAVSGAVVLTVDITASLNARLDTSATHMGITLATLDENTATSIDNLGFSGAGPAGANGSAMPHLTVVTVEPGPPAFDAAERKCQAAIAQSAQFYGTFVNSAFRTCFNRVLKDTANNVSLAAATTSCTKALPATLLRTLSLKSVLRNCPSPLTPASVNSPCVGSATTFTEVAECVFDAASIAVQRSLPAFYADACSLITAVGLDLDYPEICAAE